MSKCSFIGRSIATASLVICSALAHAIPVTFDFTGTGTINTYNGGPGTPTITNHSFTGYVTIDVLAAGPSGADSETTAVSAYDSNGWVQTDFFIDWGSGNFNPSTVAGLTASQSYASVYNDADFDLLLNNEVYRGFVGTVFSVQSAQLRRATDQTWLNDLSFDTSLGLAPPNGINEIGFNNYSFNTADSVPYLTGQIGRFDLTTLAPRTASVPEPGTLLLLGFGLAGLSFARRRAKQ